MKHSEKIVEAVFPTSRETAEVLKPCKEPPPSSASLSKPQIEKQNNGTA
jgi:hypothetical protein